MKSSPDSAPFPNGLLARLTTVLHACFDWRTTIVAAVLACAAALPYISRGIESRDFYFFDVTLTSSSPGDTQVFWDLGKGYSEAESSRQPLKVEPKPVVYRFMLPMGTIRELRLDPIDGLGFFTFSHARVVDYRGHLIRSFAPEDFTAAQQLARCEKMNDTLVVQTAPDARDPVLLLKLKTPLELRGDWKMWVRIAKPITLRVFLLGMIVGAPAVASRLWRWATQVGRSAVRRPRTAVMITALLAVTVQSHPVIFLGRSFASPNNGALMLYGTLPTLPGNTESMYANTMGSDVGALLFQHVYYPMAQRRALLRDHELPLWNRYSLCGEPLLGQGQSMFGNPFNFVTMLANSNGWAWDVQFVIAHWLLAAGLGLTVWALTRQLGASLLVTLGAGFISFFTHRLNHPANFSVCYSPWILWAWVGLLQAPTRRAQAGWLCGLIAANWTVMTSGTIKEAYMLIACLNFAGVLSLWLLPSISGRWQRLGLASAAGAIFIFISAPWWVSFLVAWKHSFSGYDMPGVQSLPIAHLLGLFDDIFHRQLTKDEIVKAPGLNFLFLLGALWWVADPRSWRGNRAAVAIALAVLVPLVFAFGLVPDSLVVKIPFVANIIHTGNTFSCVLLIVVSILAGFGFAQAFRTQDNPTNPWLVALRVLGLGAVMAGAYFFSTRGVLKSHFFEGYVPALGLAASTLLLTFVYACRSAFRRPGPICTAVILGLPLLLWRHCQFRESHFEFYAYTPALRADFHAPSASVQFIDRNFPEHGRIAGWENNLFPSYNTALDWESLYGVDALRNRYYTELAVEFGMERVWFWDVSSDEKNSPQLVPVQDVLNVTHYVATPRPLPHAIAGLEWLGQQDFDVYRSPTAWPRAFFTDRLARYSTPKDFAALVRNGDRRPFAAIQANDEITTTLSPTLVDRVVRPAREYHFTSNTSSFVIEASGPGVAVLTEAFYPEDFRVTLNGQPVSYFRANHAFKAVLIPAAGKYEIRFSYWPQYFTGTLWACALGVLLLVIGFWILSRRRTQDFERAPLPVV